MSGVEVPSGRAVPLLTPGSPEWLCRMSASKIAAVVGLSPYMSRFTLFNLMAGLLPPQPQTKAMSRGHYLEPAIAAWFADRYPDCRVEKTGTFVHADREWQVASPDRLLVYPSGHTEVLQCKSAADASGWGPDGSDEIPPGYWVQVQWEMSTVGVSTCHVAVILPFLEFRSYVIRYDRGSVEWLVEEARSFLDDLAAGRRPSIDEHRSTWESVRVLHPDIQPVKVDVPAGVGDLYVEALATFRDAEEQKRFATALLADHMGSAEAAYLGGRCIARRQAKNGGTPYVVASRDALRDGV